MCISQNTYGTLGERFRLSLIRYFILYVIVKLVYELYLINRCKSYRVAFRYKAKVLAPTGMGMIDDFLFMSLNIICYYRYIDKFCLIIIITLDACLSGLR